MTNAALPLRPAIIFKKKKVNIDHMVGVSYGSSWALSGRDGFVRISSAEEWKARVEVVLNEEETGEDNSELVDRPDSNQALTSAAVADMKRSALDKESTDGGAQAELQLVEAIKDGSKTFSSKTVYSQAKYITKKRSKHAPVYVLMRATAQLIAQHEFRTSDQQEEVMHIRWDVLARMVYVTAPICSQQRPPVIGVAEQCGGLLLHAIVQRLNLQGGSAAMSEMPKIFYFHGGTKRWPANPPFLKYYPLPGQLQRTIISVPMTAVGAATSKPPAAAMKGGGGKDQKTSANVELLSQHSPLDSLVVAIRHNMLEGFLALFEGHLCSGGSFVVYSRAIEPLSILEHGLRLRGQALCMKIEEINVRPWQILPNRSHPPVKDLPTSGFLLTGLKECPDGKTAPKIQRTTLQAVSAVESNEAGASLEGASASISGSNLPASQKRVLEESPVNSGNKMPKL